MSIPKIVWITGASSGIGRALALQYANNGDTVYASARDSDTLNELASESSNLAGEIIPASLDVTNDSAIDAFLSLRKKLNTVPDIAIFNAGFYEPIALRDVTLEHFEKTVDVNYMGVVRCFTALLPLFIERTPINGTRGHMVFVSSVAGYSGLPKAAAYGSTKAALINLAESIKPECNELDIDVSIINPGFVKTPMTDLNSFKMPFMISPEQAASRIFAGIVAKRFEVTFPRRFTWGLKFLRLLPYPVYFYLTKKLQTH